MAKKKKKIQETTIENYYDLKVDKIDELVAALREEPSETDSNDLSMFISDCTGNDDPKNYTRSGKKKEFDPYKTDFLGKIPAWVKALFIKWWFAGMCCYFIIWGLDFNALDKLVLLGLVEGVVVDILVNPLFRYIESDRKEFNSYMMFPFPFKAFWTFFTNVIYYTVITVCVGALYGLMHDLFNAGLGVEPLLFGVFFVIIDMACIGIKDLIVYLVKKSKKEKALNV
ncbi:MAG: hypothetical protein K2K38_02180 [Clostridia bacterium]|nr:hypothetical protein [Clostridia bacterium]